MHLIKTDLEAIQGLFFHKIFFYTGLIFGLLYLFLTPPYYVPDETPHTVKACEVSNGVFYKTKNNYTLNIFKMSSKTLEQKCSIFTNQPFNIDMYFKNYNPSGFYNFSSYPPLLYAASGMAMKTGSLFSDNHIVLLYLSRLANLFVWLALLYHAIKITPVFKGLFLFLALLPMNLYLGMSVSADSFNFAFTCFFIAYMLKLIFTEQNLSVRDLSLVSVFSFLSVFTKGMIFPIFLVLLIPKKYFAQKYIFSPILLVSVLAFFMFINSSNALFTRLNAQELLIQKKTLLHHPLSFISILFASLKTNAHFYIESLFGRFRLLDIRLAPRIYNIMIFMFVTSLFVLTEKNIKFSQRLFAVLVFLIYTLNVFALSFLTWTFPDSKVIEGVQGRYFAPMIPFLFLAFGNKVFKFSKKFKSVFICIMFFVIIYSNISALNVIVTEPPF